MLLERVRGYQKKSKTLANVIMDNELFRRHYEIYRKSDEGSNLSEIVNTSKERILGKIRNMQAKCSARNQLINNELDAVNDKLLVCFLALLICLELSSQNFPILYFLFFNKT